jgi:hypothetical protein
MGVFSRQNIFTLHIKRETNYNKVRYNRLYDFSLRTTRLIFRAETDMNLKYLIVIAHMAQVSDSATGCKVNYTRMLIILNASNLDILQTTMAIEE